MSNSAGFLHCKFWSCRGEKCIIRPAMNSIIQSFSLYCSSVWSQSEDDKLFISWGSLNTVLRAGECKRGYSCIIHALYIQNFTSMQAHTQLQQSQKTDSNPRVSRTSIDVSLFATRETFIRSIRKEKKEWNMQRLCVVLCVMSGWIFFPHHLSFPSQHTLSLCASRLGSRACGGGARRQCISRARVRCLP